MHECEHCVPGHSGVDPRPPTCRRARVPVSSCQPAGCGSHAPRRAIVPGSASSAGDRGFTLVELVTACAVAGVAMALAVPLVAGSLDGIRAEAAARYVAGRLQHARMEALKRSAHVACRFARTGETYELATVVDGNGNGVRTAEIASGVDWPVPGAWRPGNSFPGVSFGCVDGVAGIDGDGALTGCSPIKVGSAGLVSFSPIGGATAGTIYLRGPSGQQLAVRITGATGRVRVLEFDRGAGDWIPR